MQDALRFVRSGSQQTPQIIASGRFELLATYIEADIQDPGTGQALFDAVQGAYDNSREDFEISGNAHAVSLIGKYVAINSLFDEDHPGLTLPVELFLCCVKGWVEFLTRKNLLILRPHSG